MPKSGAYLNQAQPKTEGDIELVKEGLDDCFDYHPWSDEQVAAGKEVRDTLKAAALAIIKNVPPSADRSTALRKIREARMDANSAITHNGKY